ncbi:nitrous oxide-stimulated promoter family protein [Parvimonas micra]
MKKSIEKKRDREKKVISEMVKLYCRKNHKKRELCDECKEVLNYSLKRIDNCQCVETKLFCSSCKFSLYSPRDKEKVKQIMKFSGPRILFHHPLLVISHMLSRFKK